MYLTAHETNPFATYGALSQQAFVHFCSLGKHCGEPVTLTSTADLYADNTHQGHLYLITDGSASLGRHDANIITLEPGDIIGVEEALGAPLGPYSLPFAIKCTRFSMSTVLHHQSLSLEASAAWNKFLTYRSAAFSAALLQTNAGEKIFEPVVTTYNPGAVIIEEASPSSDVYTLLSGHAIVRVQGVQVGEIYEDEIFGALAALSEKPRMATVIAQTACVVLAVSKHQFNELIAARPRTVQKLVEDMARTINDLNKTVVSMTSRNDYGKLFR
jgi:CRP/FNR family cyclic AMP-dependent transcriptional regulator